jgi:hypothetical protein
MLKGKVALVIGACRGIGRAIARNLCQFLVPVTYHLIRERKLGQACLASAGDYYKRTYRLINHTYFYFIQSLNQSRKCAIKHRPVLCQTISLIMQGY